MGNNVMSVEIKLDKVRHLKLGYRAMKKYEDAFGVPFLETIKEFILYGENGISPKISTMVNIAWAGLVWEDENLTPDDVADLFDGYGIENLFGKIQAATEYGLGGDEGNAKAGATKAIKEKVTPA